jgi:hypothetical protein
MFCGTYRPTCRAVCAPVVPGVPDVPGFLIVRHIAKNMCLCHIPGTDTLILPRDSINMCFFGSCVQ